MDNRSSEVSFLMMRIHRHHRRNISAKMLETGLDQETIANGRIIGYLRHNTDKVIYQKDIEKATGLTKSAISNILTFMEKKGYIVRKSVEGDARLKKIELTPVGLEAENKIAAALKAVDDGMLMGLTDEDMSELIRLLTLIIQNEKNMEAGQK